MMAKTTIFKIGERAELGGGEEEYGMEANRFGEEADTSVQGRGDGAPSSVPPTITMISRSDGGDIANSVNASSPRPA